jgi:Ankyrin repeats (many copies)
VDLKATRLSAVWRGLLLLALGVAAPNGARSGDAAAAYGNLADPSLRNPRLADLARVPVPSIRAAVATNPSVSENTLMDLAQDPYDSVSHAGQEQLRLRFPETGSPRFSKNAGSKQADPDYGELREMIDKGRALEAAFAWRHLPAAARSSLMGVCHWDKTKDKMPLLLDFITMAEPAGGPLTANLFSQLISGDPDAILQMRQRGLVAGIQAYPLYESAVGTQDSKAVGDLAGAGLNVDSRSEKGMTPLMAAARKGDIPMILMLLELGADPEARDANNHTASDHARMTLNVDAAQFLAIGSEARTQAEELSGRFSEASPDSHWVGRWITDKPDGNAPFAYVEFRRDGSFDMPPGPTGKWREVDFTHAVASPLQSGAPAAGSSPTLYGDYSFERSLDPDSVTAAVKAHGEVLTFQLVGAEPDASTRRAGAFPLAVPTGLKSSSSLEKIQLTWSASPGASGYFLYRNGSLLTPRMVVGTSYTDSSIPAASFVSYEVQAADAHLHLSAFSAPEKATIVLTDTEGKGLPDRWQMRYFGHLGVDPAADPDGDGFSDLDEYRNGTNPMDFYNGESPLLTFPYGHVPGPDDQLAMVVHHADGRPWANAPVPMRTSPGRGISVVKATPPYLHYIKAHSDATGLVQVFLQPLK